MSLEVTSHPICKKGFRRSTNSGNYSRWRRDINRNHWIDKVYSKNQLNGWQARSYQCSAASSEPHFYWEGPIVSDPWTAYVTGELAG